MDNLKIANEWFTIADMDLSSAKYLQNMKPTPIEIICYHCQQSAEKYLKGYLALNSHEILKTHDLILLNKLCCEYDKDFEIIGNECLRLTDYGVVVRYPYPLDLNVADMTLAIKDAENIKNFTLKISGLNDSRVDNK